MKNKIFSIDIISYFFRFIFLIVIGILVIFLSINVYSLFELLFSNIEKRLCIYKSILESNNVVSTFLINHFYDVFGSKSYSFLENSQNIYDLTIFLKCFEVFKYIYFIIIALFSYKLINKYSKNNIYLCSTNNNLLIISILIILVPIIYILRDIIGCYLVNQLPIKEKQLTIPNFHIYYLLIGTILLFTYLFNYFHINNKKINILFVFKRLAFVLFTIYFGYLFIINIGSLINVLKIETDKLTYIELTKSKDQFIVLLVNHGFKIFGKSWTYLGLNNSFKTPIIIYYLFNILTNLLLVFYCVFTTYIESKEFNGSYYKSNIKQSYYLFGILILKVLLEMIVMIVVISIYKDYEYYNKNLEYGIFNYEYLYYITLFVILFISQLTYKEIEKNRL